MIIPSLAIIGKNMSPVMGAMLPNQQGWHNGVPEVEMYGNLYIKGPNIKYCFQKGMRAIHDAHDLIWPNDLSCIMSPSLAFEIVQNSQELHYYLKQAPFAIAELRGDAPSKNAIYSLPSVLYGCKIHIEDKFEIIDESGFLWDKTTACMLPESVTQGCLRNSGFYFTQCC